jgi:hypothetical protein
MLSLLSVIPQSTDATAFYRSTGPLSHMRKDYKNINIVFANHIDWSVIKLCDAVFMQRPFRPQDLTVATITKENNRPLWVDYDDDLFSVPSDNPTHIMYGSPDIQKNVANIIALADVVTVSTPALKKKYDPLNKNIIVVPNGIDDDLLKGHELFRGDRRASIMWRGSQTHERDLMSVSGELLKIATERPNLQWEFVGYNPWFITDLIKGCRIEPGKDIPGYFRHIYQQRPGYFICPLFPNIFNKSKSNIAWIEATYAGAPCLAPSWEEWVRPGCLNYNGPTEFREKLIAMVGGDIDCDKQVQESWDYIRENLTMKKTNEIRKKIIEEFIL